MCSNRGRGGGVRGGRGATRATRAGPVGGKAGEPGPRPSGLTGVYVGYSCKPV